MQLKASPKRVQFFRGQIFVLTGVAAIALAFLGTFFGMQRTAIAATNSTINFQARLLTAAGAVVPDGDYNVEFKIYNSDSSSGSSQGSCSGDTACLWTETRIGANAVHVVNGYLAVNLGSITPFSATINWDQDLYLTMNIGGISATPTWDGEMSPRLHLTAVPYAFRAGQLASLQGSNTSTLGFATQTSANSILLPDASGTICLQNVAACGFAPVTGGSGYIQLQGGTPGTTQTGNFNIDGMGIAGTGLQTPSLDTPSAGALSIGSANATSVSIGNSTAATTVTLQGGTGSSAVSLLAGTNGNVNTTTTGTGLIVLKSAASVIAKSTTNQLNAFQVQNASGVAALDVDTTDGYVGIGTTTPGATLDVQGAIQQLGLITPNTSTTAVNYWTELGTCNITIQYQVCLTTINILGGRNGTIATANTQGTVSVRVEQANSMGNAPTINVTLNNAAEVITRNDIVAVTTQNTGANTTVQLWGRITIQNEAWSYTPVLNASNYPQWVWTPNSTFQSSLPTGTQTAAVYGDTVAGIVTLTGGQAADITTDASSSGTANGITIKPGASGGSASSGAAISIQAGTGAGTGVGGRLTLQGGNSGSGAAAAGGAVQIQGGTANGSGVSNGGNIILQGGAASGTGTKGQIQIDGGLLYTTATFSSGTSATITQSAIDSNSTVLATATVGGLTFTVPSPTVITAGRILLISNVGTASFVVAGTSGNFILNSGSTATLMWNGSAWTNAGIDASTLQTVYGNSTGGTTPQITLNSTENDINIQTNGTLGNAHNFLSLRDSNASGLGNVEFGFGIGGNYFQKAKTDVSGVGNVLFVVQNSTGKTLFNVDSQNSVLNLGSTGTQALATTLNLATSASGAEVLNLGSATANSAASGTTLLLQGGSTSSAVSIQALASGTIGIGTTNAGNTIQIGSTTLTATQNIGIGNNATSGGTTNVTIGAASGATGGTLTLQGTAITETITGGSDTIKSTTNNTAAFSIQNSTPAAVFTVDTSTGNGRVLIGTGAGRATPALLIVDNGNSSDPAGVNGAMYYNSSMHQFRCYNNDQWENCQGLDSDAFRQQPFYATDFLDNGPLISGGGYTETGGPWTGYQMASGTLTAGSLSTQTAGHPGVVRIASSTSANSGLRYALNGSGMFMTAGLSFELTFYVDTAINTNMRIGFYDSGSTSAPGNGMWISVAGSGVGNGLTINGKTAGGSGTTTTSNYTLASAGNWYRAKIVANSTNDGVSFYLYSDAGTQLWTASSNSNLPNTSSSEFGPGVMAYSTNTAVTNLVDLDYMALWWSSSLAR